jgi:hypothetical protein
LIFRIIWRTIKAVALFAVRGGYAVRLHSG